MHVCLIRPDQSFIYFFFNDTATTEIYTLSLHDALPICKCRCTASASPIRSTAMAIPERKFSISNRLAIRSEEHTSELQSRRDLVCRLLLEKKKKNERPNQYKLSMKRRSR